MDNAQQVSIVRITGDSVNPMPDMLAIEEPLEMRLSYGTPPTVKKLAVTMRTPGHDDDLAVGFLFTEGIITGRDHLQSVDHEFLPCSENRQNVILVTLKPGIIPNLQQAERNFYTTSSCGVCGKASIDAIRTLGSAQTQKSPNTEHGSAQTPKLPPIGNIEPALLLSLPQHLAAQQRIFAETGGLHAAALFDNNGSLINIREDVGRHNALDKLIGAALMDDKLPLTNTILLLSGRASFELVQKAAMAQIPVIAAVGAPSTLAVSLAEEFGITLIGFLRNNRFNIYSGAHRVQTQKED